MSPSCRYQTCSRHRRWQYWGVIGYYKPRKKSSPKRTPKSGLTRASSCIIHAHPTQQSRSLYSSKVRSSPFSRTSSHLSTPCSNYSRAASARGTRSRGPSRPTTSKLTYKCGGIGNLLCPRGLRVTETARSYRRPWKRRLSASISRAHSHDSKKYGFARRRACSSERNPTSTLLSLL